MEETRPILAAFHALTTAIGNAFARDSAGANFPESIRQLVLEEIAGIRSGMLLLIGNRSSIQDRKPEESADLLPALRLIRGLMKQDASSIEALSRYEERILPVLQAASPNSPPANVDVPMLTGENLPPLLRDAIVILKTELARLAPTARSLNETDVILVRDVRRLGEQLHVASQRQMSQLSEQFLMFVSANRPPIYVIEDRPSVLAAMAFYQKGRAAHLRYTFAAMLVHEWCHAFAGERGEAKAYAFELELLQGFWDRGLLPPQCASDIQSTKKRLLEAQRNEAITGPDQRLKLPLKNR